MQVRESSAYYQRVSTKQTAVRMGSEYTYPSSNNCHLSTVPAIAQLNILDVRVGLIYSITIEKTRGEVGIVAEEECGYTASLCDQVLSVLV